MAKAEKKSAVKMEDQVAAVDKAVKSDTSSSKSKRRDETAAPSVPFEIKPLHQKALLKLLHCHHNNDQALTYSELSAEIGVGEKTKAWQCVAWKDLKSNEYIIPAVESRTFKLSQQGIDLAMTFASDEELAEFMVPATNEEHQEKIRKKLLRNDKAKKTGPKIFDLLLEDPDAAMTCGELAAKLDTNPDAHGFFYGFQALKKMGMVCEAGVADKPFENKAAKKKNKRKKNKAGGEEDDEKEEDSDGDSPKLEKKKPRIRGGKKMFKLSEKAFLASSS